MCGVGWPLSLALFALSLSLRSLSPHTTKIILFSNENAAKFKSLGVGGWVLCVVGEGYKVFMEESGDGCDRMILGRNGCKKRNFLV